MKNKNKNDSHYQNYPTITGYVLETITGYVLDDVTLNVREFPSTDAKIINKLPGGSEVTIDARTKDEARKYKVEPYSIPADIYSAENLAGRGGWTWYTGSSSWFYKIGLENILGFKIQKNKLTINPCIPKEWKEYSIKYRYGKTIYNITVKNENGKNTGVEKIIINGKEEKEIILQDDGKTKEITIIL